MRSLARLFAVLGGVLALHLPLRSQIQSNFSILDSLAERAVALVCAQVRCDSVVIVPTDSPARWLIVEKLTAEAVAVRPTGPCTLAIADCAVRYALHPRARDSVERVISIELRAITPDTVVRVRCDYRDNLARSDVAAAELPRSALTSSPVPPPPRSVWDDLLEPVVIVGSVATTLLLLFTVRTR